MKYIVMALCVSLTLEVGAPVALAQEGVDHEQINRIVEKYIMAHPEVIERSMQAYYEEKKRQARERELSEAFANSKLLGVEGLPLKGNPSGQITIVEFSDFQCPYCAQSVNTLSQVQKKYRDKVRIAYKHFPLSNHAAARSAAKASLAAEKQGKFWAYHDMLMRRQSEWGAAPEPVILFVDYARKLGLDPTQFKNDFSDPNFDARIDRDVNLGNELRIQATPTFFVNGVHVRGAVDVAYFSEVIDKLLAEK
ncbi:MAG: DsbA family protein [Nitrospinota bacterium]|nr:DsbA family protein [Nitrospinota bacterium]